MSLICYPCSRGPASFLCQLQYRTSLVPRPSPSFPSLALPYCKRREAGRGPGNEVSTVLQAGKVPRNEGKHLYSVGGGSKTLMAIQPEAVLTWSYIKHSVVS